MCVPVCVDTVGENAVCNQVQSINPVQVKGKYIRREHKRNVEERGFK